MELNNWIKRKYPIAYEILLENFEESKLQNLKDNNYKIGILSKDIGLNKAGDFVIYKKLKQYNVQTEYGYENGEKKWSGNYEYHYIFSKKSDMFQDKSYKKYINDITLK